MLGDGAATGLLKTVLLVQRDGSDVLGEYIEAAFRKTFSAACLRPNDRRVEAIPFLRNSE